MADRSVNIALTAKDKTKGAVAMAQGHLRALQRTAIVVGASIKAAFVSAGAAINAFGRFAISAFRHLRTGLYISAAAGAGLLVFLNSAIKSAKEQELAERKLEAAFLGSGKATREGIAALKQYAEALQKTTGFGDEQIINAQAMLGTFQLTDKQVMAATPRLLDMAAAMQQLTGTQVDLQQIAIAVGKGLTGQVGILSRYGVVISDEVKNSGNFNDILIELDKNFKGIAETIGQGTYVGAITGMGNAYDEMKEKIGAVITESDKFRGFLNTLRDGFEKLSEIVITNTDSLRELAEGALQKFIVFAAGAAKAGVVMKAIFGLLKGVIETLILAVKIAFDNFVKFFKLLETLPLVGKHIKAWRKDIVDGLGEVGDILSGESEKGGFVKEIKSGFEAIDKASEKFNKKFVDNTKKSVAANAELKDRISKLKPVTEEAAAAAEEMSKEQIAAMKETEKAYASIADNIYDTVSNLLFTRLTQRGIAFRDTMTNIFRDIGDNIVRTFTNAASTAAMNLLGINQMLSGIAGGAGVVGAPRVVQTTAGGISNLGVNAPAITSRQGVFGVGGRQVSTAAAQVGMGVAVSGGQRLLTQPNIPATGGSNFRNTLPVGIAAGQGLFSAGGIGSTASMARLGFAGLGAVLRRLPFTPFPTALGRTASNIIGRGSALISRATGLTGTIGGLLSSFIPLGSLGRGRGSGIGGSIGSIGGALLGAPFGGIGSAAGAFLGGGIGRAVGGLFGRGGSNRNLNFGLGVPENLSRFGIPSQITARSYRSFGPQIVAAELGVQAARGDIIKRAQALGLGEQPEIQEAARGTGVTYSPADAIAKIQASLNRLGIGEMVVQGVEKALENAVVNGLSAGFQAATASRGFETMIDEMKSTIIENISKGLIDAVNKTAAFKSVFAKAIVPVTTFLAGQEGKEIFDVEGFKNAVATVEKLPGLGESQKLFESLFAGLKSLEGKLFGENTSSMAAEAIRIPKLQHGGVITKSGLAFVDRGESFSGTGKSKMDLFNKNDSGSGIYIDLKGANVNLSSSQNINAVAQELGRRTRLEINKPRQFSTL